MKITTHAVKNFLSYHNKNFKNNNSKKKIQSQSGPYDRNIIRKLIAPHANEKKAQPSSLAPTFLTTPPSLFNDIDQSNKEETNIDSFLNLLQFDATSSQ